MNQNESKRASSSDPKPRGVHEQSTSTVSQSGGQSSPAPVQQSLVGGATRLGGWRGEGGGLPGGGGGVFALGGNKREDLEAGCCIHKKWARWKAARGFRVAAGGSFGVFVFGVWYCMCFGNVFPNLAPKLMLLFFETEPEKSSTEQN